MPMTKQHFIQCYPELAASKRINGYLGTTLTLPEIQAQVKRILLHTSDLDDEGKEVYTRFLECTNAAEGIEHRYTGEHCTRLFISRDDLALLLKQRPSSIHGGIAYLRQETPSTCISWKSSIDPDMSNWLRQQGVRMEHTWESEIRHEEN